MTNEDGSLVLVFNGEIYNSPELRRLCEANGHSFKSSMDGEVILHLWEDEGLESLARLNGIFAFAMVNLSTGEITLVRDPLGVKPLFYSTSDKRELWFASELSALRTIGAPVGGPDVVGLGQFLSFLWIPDPHTPFENATSLPPATALSWRQGKLELHTYWSPEFPSDALDSLALADANEVLRGAAERQLLADVPIGLMASGGIDSSLLWAYDAENLAAAYCIEWQNDTSGEHLAEDSRAVRRLQSLFGTPVTYLAGESVMAEEPPVAGDLFADPAFDLTRQIAKAARDDGIKVLLSGQGGDELFGGYRRYLFAQLLDRGRLRVVASLAQRLLARGPRTLAAEYGTRLARAANERDPFRGYMQLGTYSTAQERARVLHCTEAEVSDDVMWARHYEVYRRLPDHISFLRKAMAVELQVYLPGLNLSYADRAGMEHGVEIRVPLLDLEVVQWSLAIPDRMLVRRLRGKLVAKQLAASVLPAEVVNRPKRGFAAPIQHVNPGGRDEGDRGFRQGAYFARAQRMVEAHLQLVS
jgi:asparagine synthase (glutamine-hydrolysing)